MILKLIGNEFFVSCRIWLLVLAATWFCMQPMLIAMNPAAFTCDEHLYALLILAGPAIYLAVLLAVTLSTDDRDRVGIHGTVAGSGSWQILLSKLGWAVFSTLTLQAAELGVVFLVIGPLRSRPFDWGRPYGTDNSMWFLLIDLLLLGEVGAWGLWWASNSLRASTALFGTATCVLGLYGLTSMQSHGPGYQFGWLLLRLILAVGLFGSGTWFAMERVRWLREQLPPTNIPPDPLEAEHESTNGVSVTVPAIWGNRPRTAANGNRRESASVLMYVIFLGIALAYVGLRFGQFRWFGDPYRMRLPLWWMTTMAGVLAMRSVHPSERLLGLPLPESNLPARRLESFVWLRQIAIWGLIMAVTNAVGIAYSWMTIKSAEPLAARFLESFVTTQWIASGHSWRGAVALGLFMLTAFGAGLFAGTCFRNGIIAFSAAVLLSGFAVDVLGGIIYWYAAPIEVLMLIPLGLFLGSWLLARQIPVVASAPSIPDSEIRTPDP